jgi:hypothetical protein
MHSLQLTVVPEDSVDPLDTNRDGNVTANDAVILVNYLNRRNTEGESLAITDQESVRRMDTNGDGRVSAADFLKVVNRLRGKSDSQLQLAEGEAVVASPISSELSRTPIDDHEDDMIWTLTLQDSGGQL